jgi:hypothetical protein
MSESHSEVQTYWKLCSVCKKPIPFQGIYYVCTVSTCRSKRVNLIFCSTLCWDGHLGYARHRNAACEEEKAPAN